MGCEKIIAALEAQVQLYRQLVELAGEQHRCVNAGETDQLIEVLDRRQGVLRDVGEIEQQVRPVLRGWQDFISTLNSQQRRRVQGLIIHVRELLEQITTADRKDTMVLQKRRAKLGRGRAFPTQVVNARTN